MLPLYEWKTLTPDTNRATQLAATFGLHHAVARLITARGWLNDEEIEKLLSPSLSHIGQPDEFPGTLDAAQRLWQAIDNNETIVVYGDYDADGVSAAAILAMALKTFGANVETFIPHRLNEGYGLSPEALDRFDIEHPNAHLVVTVDCGITAQDGLLHLRRSGHDVIITDHHVPDPTLDLSAACAIITTHHPDTPPNCRDLCGAGVAFKLACTMWKTGKRAKRQVANDWDPKKWLEVVAVATVADVVPLQGENRTMVYHGIKSLEAPKSPGLKKLLDKARSKATTPTSHHLAFILAPRLNAPGRIDDARIAYELLCTSNETRARELVAQLEKLNLDRRKIEDDCYNAAIDQLSTPLTSAAQSGAIVVGGPDWHLGTVGIVASRLCDQTGVPAAVADLAANGAARGSLRACNGYDALAALSQCSQLLDNFGGHRLAAGFAVKPGCFDQFRHAFAAACLAQRPDITKRPELEVDAWLTPDELTPALFTSLSRLEPFGEGHRKPCWGIRGITLHETPRPVGSDGQHISLRVNCANTIMRGIWFRSKHLLDHLTSLQSQHLDIAFECLLNRYQGSESLEMQLVDVRPTAASSRA
ncbi:MAG: single-stranded-DNA-specific exonuclease RecJ [Lentisphaerae bacterium]|jgi:single-stranded-DNA-specific exonuclease|nr:single-stranded-DNA-specific exonuclease RecJ [Lentisphaerota bacterium]